MLDGRQSLAGAPRRRRGALTPFVFALSLAATAQADENGRQLFNVVSQPPCSVCHTMAAAGAAGEIGPNLDELKPSVERISRAVRQGVGVMPGYRETLSDAQIEALVRYVARSIGAAP
jgi:cytochrome c6